MKFLKWIILPLIFLTVLAYMFAPASYIELADEIWYRHQLYSMMKQQIPAAREAMQRFLNSKYGEEFIVARPGIQSDLMGQWFSAEVFPAENPDIKFTIKTDFFSFSKRNFSKEAMLSKFYDHYPSEVMDYRMKKLESLFHRFYPPKNSSVSCRFIKGSNDDFRELDFNKVEVGSRDARNVNDMALHGIIYSDTCVVEDEAEKLYQIFSDFFQFCKIRRCVITVGFYPAIAKKEFAQNNKTTALKNSKNTIDKAPIISFREHIEKRFKQGILHNVCIIFGLENQSKPISKQQIIDSFKY